MDPISFAGAYQSLKAAKDILAVVFDAKVDAEVRPRILEAQAKLGEVQDSLFLLRERLAELQQERDQLRAEVAGAQEWRAVAADYELCNTLGGAVVYRYKGAPEHYACHSCFNRRERHILQDNHSTAGTFRCTGCGSNFRVEPSQPGSLKLGPHEVP